MFVDAPSTAFLSKFQANRFYVLFSAGECVKVLVCSDHIYITDVVDRG